LFLVIADDTIG